jgi:putative oxidoreductase
MATIFSSKGVWDKGIIIVRVTVAYLMFRHSLELFSGMGGLIEFLTDVKFPFPVFVGYAAKIIEFAGSILLALGLFTRIVAPLLVITMLGVIYTMHRGDFFDGEHPFLFLLIFLLFFLNGPGKWSLDYLFFDRRNSAPDASSR